MPIFNIPAILGQLITVQAGEPSYIRSLLVVGAIALAVVGCLIFGVLQNRQARRRMEHLERVEALRLGIVLPDREGDTIWAKAWTCTSIGLGVPMVSFFATFLILTDREDIHPGVWIVPGVVSGLSVIGSLTLASQIFKRSRRLHDGSQTNATMFDHDDMSKRVADPDAYDVAASRC